LLDFEVVAMRAGVAAGIARGFPFPFRFAGAGGAGAGCAVIGTGKV
jgi:hypothetical protein